MTMRFWTCADSKTVEQALSTKLLSPGRFSLEWRLATIYWLLVKIYKWESPFRRFSFMVERRYFFIYFRALNDLSVVEVVTGKVTKMCSNVWLLGEVPNSIVDCKKKTKSKFSKGSSPNSPNGEYATGAPIWALHQSPCGLIYFTYSTLSRFRYRIYIIISRWNVSAISCVQAEISARLRFGGRSLGFTAFGFCRWFYKHWSCKFSIAPHQKVMLTLYKK